MKEQEVFMMIATYMGFNPKSKEFGEFVQTQVLMSKIANYAENNKGEVNAELPKIIEEYQCLVQAQVEANLKRVIKNLKPEVLSTLQKDSFKVLEENTA